MSPFPHAPGFSRRAPGVRAGFTLVELLVTISIIAVLATLLLPTIAVAMEKSRRVVCSSNFKQCGLALYSYAADHDDRLPRVNTNSNTDADVYQMAGMPSLVTLMRPFITDFKVWRCPATRSVPIDDPRNTTATRRMSLVYWPHLSYGTSPNAFSSPGNLAHHSSKTALMQDQLYLWSGQWRANHSRGGVLQAPLAGNPSLAMYFNGQPRGVNILHGDGHVSWTPWGPALVGVYGRTSSMFYSRREFRK